jgi:hypothetical protein
MIIDRSLGFELSPALTLRGRTRPGLEKDSLGSRPQ